ncbi:DUF2515 family protein [Bartonella sp. HY038]|uniref:DUF2515 family protein n=1 Tax=Bartonella sp. HY038 TaxID=2759660 RepID=UPI0015FBAC5D|nr:hypothetical protein [Bartonella sp. HY038]
MSSDYPIIIYRHEDDEDYTPGRGGSGPLFPRELHPGTATSNTPSELEINMGHVITCRHSCEDIFKEANRAVKNAETISNPRKRNSTINNHYANLYEAGIYGDSRILPSPPSGGRFASPNYWSGMAAIVSFQLGCMMAYSEGVFASKISTKWMQDLLDEANLGIFKKCIHRCSYFQNADMIVIWNVLKN